MNFKSRGVSHPVRKYFPERVTVYVRTVATVARYLQFADIFYDKTKKDYIVARLSSYRDIINKLDTTRTHRDRKVSICIYV